MQMGSSAALPGGAPTIPAPPRGWIQSAFYDVTLLLLAPLVGLPFLLAPPHVAPRLGLILCGVLGFPHYLSTFAFYFWDENHAYHREHWQGYFAGPALIALAFGALVFVDQPPLLLPTVLLLWNAVHVARQSCGVLSIYRHRAGVVDAGAKAAANNTIILASVWMCLANLESHRQVFPLFAAVHPSFLTATRWALGCAVVVAVARLMAGIVERCRRNSPMGAPEALALGSGLALFHPYLWNQDSAKAT